MPTHSQSPYVLVVRWPVGGIRTHLKYLRQLGAPGEAQLEPLIVSMDDEDTRQLVRNLQAPADNDRSAGVHSLKGMALRVLKTCFNFRVKLVHSQGFISALVAYPAVFLTRKKHIVTVHDVVTDAVLAEKSALGLLALGFVLRHATAVHAVGRDCAQSLRRLPGLKAAQNIVTIPNGINSRQFSDVQACASLKADLPVSADTRLIGFFGRFMEQKGFLDLIAATTQLLQENLPPFKIIAVGEGDYLREYRQFVTDAGLEATITFLPRAENPAALMASCAMVVMPSRWEAYPLQAPEVLSLGIPLVASDCIGLREVTEGTPARTFKTGDVAGLATALINELRYPSTEAASAYASTAQHRFDFTPNARKIYRLLNLVHSNLPLSSLESVS